MNLGSVAKQVLGTIAPTILTAIGGPFGAIAGAVLHAALGTNGDDKAADATLAGATQETLLKVKQAEIDFQAKMAELGVQREQLAYADVASARTMQTVTRDPTAGRLAWLMIGGFMALTGGVIVGLFVAPDKAKLLLSGEAGLFFGTVFGYLANEAKAAAGFYFGASASGATKDATIAEIAKSS